MCNIRKNDPIPSKNTQIAFHEPPRADDLTVAQAVFDGGGCGRVERMLLTRWPIDFLNLGRQKCPRAGTRKLVWRAQL